MKRLKIVISIYSELKSIYLGIGKILAKDHDVWILAKDINVKNLTLKLVPELSENIILISDRKDEAVDVIPMAIDFEKKYGESFSMLMSMDRGLGQGYLYNVPNHPHVKKSTWGHKKKVNEILQNFIFFEKIYNNYQFDLGIGHDRPLILDSIMQFHGKKYLTISSGRKSDKYIWMENRFEENEALLSSINELAQEEFIVQNKRIEYEHYDRYIDTINAIDYSYFTVARKALKIFIYETGRKILGRTRKDGYIYCGWIPVIFREIKNYKFIKSIGRTPDDLTDYKLIYFAMHMEPESSLLHLSPEFNNSMELIAWISKAVSSDTMIVLKENPWSFGVRSKQFYKMLDKIPNVVWAKPDISSHEWIKKSKIVVSITGTSGFEAVYFNKPVLSFGKHQAINLLPTVKYVTNYFDAKAAIEDFIKLNDGDPIFDKSKYVLDKANEKIWFSLPNYEKHYSSLELHLDISSLAVERLYNDYKTVFSDS